MERNFYANSPSDAAAKAAEYFYSDGDYLIVGGDGSYTAVVTDVYDKEETFNVYGQTVPEYWATPIKE